MRVLTSFFSIPGDEEILIGRGDFGMARLYPEDQTHVNTRVAGTNGYMAPEYVMHGKLSVKADVFSFGVLILELISGQKNSTFSQDPSAQNLLDWEKQQLPTQNMSCMLGKGDHLKLKKITQDLPKSLASDFYLTWLHTYTLNS
ncbi:hypothetical protein POM88_012341 [Heracleum sosnowskyi]|uniref:Protein kinase domain-containing protein n=1 Tax=Heracleum sosnowskyi TaxID=360622 RepID=A0AAD8MXA9_9APIA|nr:hypothetical protein POM88_012341 [Heracleum sosnowskyi]